MVFRELVPQPSNPGELVNANPPASPGNTPQNPISGVLPVPGGSPSNPSPGLTPGTKSNPGTLLPSIGNPFSSVVDFLNWLKNAIVNRNFWKGVGLLLGGVLIVGFGAYVWLGHPEQDMRALGKAAEA